jgi:hypothetical protein
MAAPNPNEDEDDYMSMVLPEAPQSKIKTSLQRRKERQRESERKAMGKSKSELAAEEQAKREALESTAIGRTNKGFQMLEKMGFKAGSSLGRQENARHEPVRVFKKEDRGGIGMDQMKKRKILEAHESQAKRVKETEDEYRARLKMDREKSRKEAQLRAAQKIAQTLSNDDHDIGSETRQVDSGLESPSLLHKHQRKPLKEINVLWRDLEKSRREKEVMARQDKKRLARQSSSDDEDVLQSNDNEIEDFTLIEEGLFAEDEDSELDEFNSLPVDERLNKIVLFLRDQHHYCFWCKFTYNDATMDGCPGTTEEDHD